MNLTKICYNRFLVDVWDLSEAVYKCSVQSVPSFLRFQDQSVTESLNGFWLRHYIKDNAVYFVFSFILMFCKVYHEHILNILKIIVTVYLFLFVFMFLLSIFGDNEVPQGNQIIKARTVQTQIIEASKKIF